MSDSLIEPHRQEIADKIERAKTNAEAKLHRQARWSGRDLLELMDEPDWAIAALARWELLDECKVWYDYDAGFWRAGKGVPGNGNVVGPLQEY